MIRKKKMRKTLTIALFGKREKIYPANVSKHNSNREKQVVLLIIPSKEG